MTEIDEGDCFARQRDYWAQIREAAALSLGRVKPRDIDGLRLLEEHAGQPYRWADAHGRVHECRTVTRLAELSRGERSWCGSRWPEDR